MDKLKRSMPMAIYAHCERCAEKEGYTAERCKEKDCALWPFRSTLLQGSNPDEFEPACGLCVPYNRILTDGLYIYKPLPVKKPRRKVGKKKMLGWWS